MPTDYSSVVDLLIRTLPSVAKEPTFALKGGTAINLFYRDLPRLSVDIDLTFLPLLPREETLKEIDAALDRVMGTIDQALPGATVKRIAGGGDGDTRIGVQEGRNLVKIETSPVTRGTIHPTELRVVTDAVQERFGFAEMNVVAFEDLYAGKLVAALDRQHPRDLFDVKLLYENEGLTDDLFRTFLVYLAQSSRPMHELIRPRAQPLEDIYAKEFEGMALVPVELADLVAARERLFADVASRMDDGARTFLLSLHDGEPDFGPIDRPRGADLPGVRWKVQNLQRLKTTNPEKHAEQRELLAAVLGD